MEIKIDRIYGVKPTGDFRCYFDATLLPWGIHIYSCKLMQGRDKVLYVYFPRRTYLHNGKTQWAEVISIDSPDLREQLAEAARVALQS